MIFHRFGWFSLVVWIVSDWVVQVVYTGCKLFYFVWVVQVVFGGT